MNKIEIKNRKADITLESVLKILLAVLCLVVLIFLAVKLYKLFTVGSKPEQAEAILNEISSKIDVLEAEDSTKYLLLSPENWYLVFYSEGDRRPIGCGDFGPCLCLCPKGTDFYDRKIIQKCEKDGRCKNLGTEKRVQFIVYEINPSYLQITGYGGYVGWDTPRAIKRNWIKLDTVKSFKIESRKDTENNEFIVIRQSSDIIEALLNTKNEVIISDKTFEEIIGIRFRLCKYSDFQISDTDIAQLEKLAQEYSQEYNGLIQIFRTGRDGTGTALRNGYSSSQTISSESTNPQLYDDSRKEYKQICGDTPDDKFNLFAVYVPEKK